jgi:hypothetical protein
VKAKSLSKFIFTLMIALAFILSNNNNIYAEVGSTGSPSPGINCVYPSNLNSTWTTPISSGVLAWNGTPTLVTIGWLSSSPNTITAANYADTWYGLNTQWMSPSYHYTIQLNATTINKDATNFDNFVKSTTAHEFGHSFRLKDNPNTTLASLMKYSRDRNTLTTPQQYDIDDVNSVYK